MSSKQANVADVSNTSTLFLRKLNCLIRLSKNIYQICAQSALTHSSFWLLIGRKKFFWKTRTIILLFKPSFSLQNLPGSDPSKNIICKIREKKRIQETSYWEPYSKTTSTSIISTIAKIASKWRTPVKNSLIQKTII